METLMITPPPRPGAPPPAPPTSVAGLPLGFDIYELNGPATVTVADFTTLKTVGKIFGILKVGDSAVVRGVRQVYLDRRFDARYPLVRAAGLIRGSFDFFAPLDVNVQVDLVVNHVQRLTPGDLAPSIDLEDQSGILNAKYAYSTSQAGRQRLLNDFSTWLNEVEKQLGRIPLVYTGVVWREQMTAANFPNLPDMSVYPLWTAHSTRANPNRGEVLRGWSDYAIWQYAENKKKGEDGSQQWGIDPYLEPGTATFDGIDYDAYNGTIYGLRGLADIGRPGVALDGNEPYIAHSEIEGHIHLIARPSGWADTDLGGSGGLAAGEDPVLMASGGSLFLYFRSAGHLVEAILASGSSNWSSNQIEEATLIHDPRVAFDGAKRYAVYWADDDDWHLMTFDAAWTGSGGILRAAGLGASTGQPAVYVTQGVPHVVGRVDRDGDLYDLSPNGSGGWNHDNVSALARDLAPALPAATYSPCAYETSGGVGIVFRGVGGHLWLINRSDNSPTDLTATTQAPVATGHPSCFVLQDMPHIVFRGIDKLIREIWLESGSWHLQQVCDATTAADPVATTNGTIALVGVRGTDGMIYEAQFDGSSWTNGATATVILPLPTPAPTPHPTQTTPTPTPKPTPTPQPTPTPTPTPGSGTAEQVAWTSPQAPFYPPPPPAPAPTPSAGVAADLSLTPPSGGNGVAIVGVRGLAALMGMVAAVAVVAVAAISKDDQD